MVHGKLTRLTILQLESLGYSSSAPAKTAVILTVVVVKKNAMMKAVLAKEDVQSKQY